MPEQTPELGEGFEEALSEMLRLEPGRGFSFRVERAHVYVERTAEGTTSRKRALMALERTLYPLWKDDTIFRDAVRAAVESARKASKTDAAKASVIYEHRLEEALNDLEFRKGLHGRKDVYDEPL